MSAKPKKQGANLKRVLAAAAVIAGPLTPLDAAPSPVQGTDPHAGAKALIHLRSYQRPVFDDKRTRIQLLEWSRQVGKSHTLANWAADRALAQLAAMLRGEINRVDWLIVVISNSKSNGAEFGVKCAAVCDLIRRAQEQLEGSTQESHDYEDGTPIIDRELKGMTVSDCAHRIEIKAGGCRARILILAASPRTARGFSGDLILDEFAFHLNAKELWGAAEPIIRSNPEYLCRIASTHNGPRSLFNQWIVGKKYPVVTVTLTTAWEQSRHDERAPLILTSLSRTDADGNPVEITPAEAREEADDLKAFDQNYECKPSTEAGCLLPWDLISSAMRNVTFAPCEGSWTAEALARMAATEGNLWAGMDVGRTKDLSTVIVLREAGGGILQCVGILRMTGNLMIQAGEVTRLIQAMKGRVRRAVIDRSGIGQGVVDKLVLAHGSLILGVNFSESVPVAGVGFAVEEEKVVREPVKEHMARELLRRFEDRSIEIPPDDRLTASLMKPEKIVTDTGKVLIAAERTKNEDGSYDHADHFWALALAVRGKELGGGGRTFTAEQARGVQMGGGSVFPGAAAPLTWSFVRSLCGALRGLFGVMAPESAHPRLINGLSGLITALFGRGLTSDFRRGGFEPFSPGFGLPSNLTRKGGRYA